MQRATDILRTQPYDKQQVLINESEADLDRLDHKQYRYNKKPKGFWISVEQEKEMVE